MLILDNIGYVEQSPEKTEVLFFTLIASRSYRTALDADHRRLHLHDCGSGFFQKSPMATTAPIDRLIPIARTILEFHVPSSGTSEA